jgi:hypothetical protein
MADDVQSLALSGDLIDVAIAEVKTSRCTLNGPWTRQDRQNVQRVLAAIGCVPMRHAIKKWAALAALIAAFFYLLLSGAEVATQRSFIMTAIVLVAVMVDRSALNAAQSRARGAVVQAWCPLAEVNSRQHRTKRLRSFRPAFVDEPTSSPAVKTATRSGTKSCAPRPNARPRAGADPVKAPASSPRPWGRRSGSRAAIACGPRGGGQQRMAPASIAWRARGATDDGVGRGAVDPHWTHGSLCRKI